MYGTKSRSKHDNSESSRLSELTVVVISGHTHDDLRIPAGANQAIAQLIGGGPKPKFANFIHRAATGDVLKLVIKRLDGITITNVEVG